MRFIRRGLKLASVGALLSIQVWAQQPTLTADQLLDKYVEAIGGVEKFAGISTWYEKREVTGDLTDYVPAGRAPTQFKKHGVVEYFFKAPNFRITSVRTDRNELVVESGCDGKESWSYSPTWGMHKQKPTPDREYACETGLKPFPLTLREAKARIEMKGQKNVDGRSTFMIRAQIPERQGWDLYYLDSQSYLLLRMDSRRGPRQVTTLFSDYREVEGVQVPFQVARHADNTDAVTKIQEVQVNVPIDDRVFRKPNF
jgi:hypothetical protein